MYSTVCTGVVQAVGGFKQDKRVGRFLVRATVCFLFFSRFFNENLFCFPFRYHQYVEKSFAFPFDTINNHYVKKLVV